MNRYTQVLRSTEVVHFFKDALGANNESPEQPLPDTTSSMVYRRDRLDDDTDQNLVGPTDHTDTPEVGIICQPVETADGKRPDQSITTLQAAWNVTNAIQGMFLVSFPYAVYQGGCWAIVAMVVIAYICCQTGKALIDCLYEEREDGRLERVRDSYVAIAMEVWGAKLGAHIVNVAQIIELLMTCILYVLLCGELLQGSFPDVPLDLTSWILISSVFVVPNAFLHSLRHVSWLSFWNVVAHVAINSIVIIYCLTRVRQWHWSEVPVSIDIWTFPIALGVIVFSYTSQIFLPTLEGNMTSPHDFRSMMHWTHAAAALFKVLFGLIGFLSWGAATQEVISNNLSSQGFKALLNMFLVAKALCSYPLPYYAAVQLLERTFFVDRTFTPFPSCWDDSDGTLTVWALALRVALVAFTVLMAIFVPHFAILMGLIGSFTGTMLSFIWPCYFHYRLKGPRLSLWQRFTDVAIIVVGAFCGVIGIYYSAHALMRAYQGLAPSPNELSSMIHCEFGSLSPNCRPVTTDAFNATMP